MKAIPGGGHFRTNSGTQAPDVRGLAGEQLRGTRKGMLVPLLRHLAQDPDGCQPHIRIRVTHARTDRADGAGSAAGASAGKHTAARACDCGLYALGADGRRQRSWRGQWRGQRRHH